MLGEESSDNSLAKLNARSQAVTAMAAILSFAVLLLSSQTNLPPWFPYVPIVLLVIGLMYSLINVFKRVSLLLLRRSITKRSFPELIILCKRFRDLTSLRMSDTIIYAFGNVKTSEGNIQIREFAQLSEWMTNNLISRLENCRRSFVELRTASHDLHALVHSFHRTYFIEGIKKARLIDPSNIGIEDRRIIEVARESFSGFIEAFQGYCSAINETLGKGELNFYFEKAKPL
jgi:hypothetical protein